MFKEVENNFKSLLMKEIYSWGGVIVDEERRKGLERYLINVLISIVFMVLLFLDFSCRI